MNHDPLIPLSEDPIQTENGLFHCKICDVTATCPSEMDKHIQGQKHCKNIKKRNQQKEIAQRRNCGIFVTGFFQPPNEEFLLNYFGQFGAIKSAYFKNHFLIIDYTNPDIASFVTQRSHYLFGRYLQVKQKIQHFPEEIVIETDNEDYMEKVLNNIKESENLDTQTDKMISILQSGEGLNSPKYRCLFNDLRHSLKFCFPQCTIHPFGSNLTGLSFNNSDVDVFISNMKTSDKDEVKALYKAKNSLIKSRKFGNIIVIPQAKIPILKCVHLASKINIDMNCKHMLGIYNCELLNYYIHLDPKIKKLAFILKYWCKLHKITGSNHLFNNYSLCLMIIFYLQQTPYEMPSVESLQRNLDVCNIEDGWNCSFNKLEYYNECMKNVTLLDLLKGFFSFYAKFDYSFDIICPFLGKAVKKSYFDDTNSLSDAFQIYKNNAKEKGTLKTMCAICIQDPIELNRTTTFGITPVTLEKFVKYCSHCVALCETEKDNVLYSLLTTAPQLKVEALSPSEGIEFSLHKGVTLNYLKNKVNDAKDMNETWFEFVVDFLKLVLKDFLNMTITEVDNVSEVGNKQKKLDGQKDIHDVKEKLQFICSSTLNMWGGRNTIAKTLTIPENQSIVQKEYTVTNILLNRYRSFSQVDELVKFEMTICFKTDPTSVTVIIKKLKAHKKMFKSFAVFIANKIPFWFTAHEKDLNKQCGVIVTN